MRYSRTFLPTLKEDPAEAEVVSHTLMVRAGLIRRLAAGVYNVLPLGLRVQHKVEAIIREEMNRAGAQEVLLPILLPAELWKETGRWEAYGKELMRLTDRHDRDFCLGPTHEEVITDMVRRDIRSYRDLPLSLYQIQTKLRDEVRPRFGVMRGREFTMKDAYSFDRNEKEAEESYRLMLEAYVRIFTRCGLRFSAVEAESGLIGGSFSHEFMVHADTGEEAITVCDACGYAANVERTPLSEEAGALPPDAAAGTDGHLETQPRKVHTPGVTTAEEVARFFGRDLAGLAKTLIYEADGVPVAVLVRGDCQVNETKLQRHLRAGVLALAGEATTVRVTGAPVGFAGPFHLKEQVPIVCDYSVKGRRNLVVGANEADHHYQGVTPERDFLVREYADLRFAREGDPCPRCGGAFRLMRGIEVGHVFKLGTKYSRAMSATFLDEKGEAQPIVMGCYGIGIGRTIAAAIEQNHDETGIIWPAPIAPFHAEVIPVNVKDNSVRKAAEDLYEALEEAGVEALLDDRDERPGVKFKDADLIGIPFHVIVGPRNLMEGKVELKHRLGGRKELLDLGRAAETVRGLVAEALSASRPAGEGVPSPQGR
ncbi:MAG: proline--tRNA ligase [Candidatus Tectomicrobia bacterium]|nr:proline--tRNA ligase [Candidatus Tectomicrobia bacterium]